MAGGAHCPALPMGSGNVCSFSPEDTAHTAPSTWYSGGACGVKCVCAASSGLRACAVPAALAGGAAAALGVAGHWVQCLSFVPSKMGASTQCSR